MAVITLATIPLELFGIVSKGIFTHRGHTHVVRRSYPKTAPSPAQLKCRRAFATADTAWGTLDATTRQEWRDYRKWERTWGYNRFMRVNIPRAFAELPLYYHPSDIP